MKFFDSHTHAHFSAFEKDSKEVIGRALANNVWLINVGTQKDTSRRAVEVAREYKEGVYATVGLHPTHTAKSYHDTHELGGGEAAKAFTSRGEEFDYKYYLELARDPKVVAIGECGLDYYRVENGKGDMENGIELQKKVFLEHIRLAEEVKKPLMIHCRPTKGTDNAYEDLLATFSSVHFPLPKIVHFYVGSFPITKKLVDAGFYFTFGGVITFARDYDESIKYIPMDRILSETDAPYVAPEPYRGKRNEPSYVVEVVKKLAELKGVSMEAMRDQIFENAEKVFKFNLVG